MKSLSIKGITGVRTRDIPNILSNLQEYDNDAIAIALCETKRREAPLPEETQKIVDSFLATNNVSESEFIQQFLQKNGADSYDDLFAKETYEPETPESQLRKQIALAQYEAHYKKEQASGRTDIVIGGVIFAVGLIITIVTLQSGGGVIAYGAIFVGFVKMARGFTKI
ncbi:hypothetical protein [Soonwooa sp.]|uniref:hypothetical protein n=1 Tax=Soonwooa sp. TaxID=1938592 RepID=UPI0026017F5A|nr:hypothetical protein [Soonwooa sp.]